LEKNSTLVLYTKHNKKPHIKRGFYRSFLL